MSQSRSIICLCAALALGASGCGESTKTASTRAVTTAPAATSAPTATSTPASESSHTASQGTSAKEAPPANKATPPKGSEKAAQAKPHPKAPGKRAKATKPSGEAGALPKVPPQKLYPRRVQRVFLAVCEAAKGSHSSCECVLARQEIANVEKGQSISENLAVEAVLQEPGASLEVLRHTRLPKGVKHSFELCKVPVK